MRINFNCWNLSVSGGNRFIFELSNRLVERKHKVTLTHVGLQKYSKWFSPIKAEIIECGYSKPERLLFKLKGKPTVKQTQERLKQHIPDCDVNIATFCLTALPTFNSKKGKPFYIVQHDETIFFQDTTQMDIARSSYLLPLKPLCVSHWLTTLVQGEYIGNGINTSLFRNYGLKRDIDVLLLDRNINWKGHYTEIAHTLTQRNLKVKLVSGNLTEKELVQAYNTSETLVYLSKREGFGYPPLEAMSCGCTVVSTSCTEYLRDGINCKIVSNAATTDEIMEAVKYAFVNSEKLRQNSLETVKEHSLEKVVDNFESCISCS